MDWSNERYVRLYTRDTVTWKTMDWRARFVLMSMLRKADRSGVIDVGADGVDGLSIILEIPVEVVTDGVSQLIHRGTIEQTSSAFLMPKFLDAQEAPASDAQRKRRERELRRDASRGHAIHMQVVENCGGAVTRGHAIHAQVAENSEIDVTPSLASQAKKESSYVGSGDLVLTASQKEVTASLRSRSRKPVDGYREVVAEFDARFRKAYATKPTWNAKTGKQVKRLLAQHGASEVIRRIGILFESPPTWLDGRFDVATLEAHFDKLVEPLKFAARSVNGLTVGRVEPKLAHEMDPRPPWEIMYERDDLRRDRHERENPPVFDPRRPK